MTSFLMATQTSTLIEVRLRPLIHYPSPPQMPTPPSGAPSPVRGNTSDVNGYSQHESGSEAAALAPGIGRSKFGALQARLAGAQAAPEGPGGRPAEFAETPFSVLSPNLQV
jgi:hypothetical protein